MAFCCPNKNKGMEAKVVEFNTVKTYIDKNHLDEPIKGKLLTDFIADMTMRKNRTQSYRSQYNVLAGHIKGFSEKTNSVIYTNSITEEFLEDFIYYLRDCNMRNNTVKGLVEKIKAITSKAGNYGFSVNRTFNEVSVPEEDTCSIALSMNEITRAYYFKGLNPRQEKIRDLFIVGCLTGMRYSDYSTLEAENIQNGIIVKKTKKTGVTVHVPIHDYIWEIMDKYGGELPRDISIQHFNRTIKVIFRKMGFTENVTFTRTVGHNVVTQTYQMWEIISSHTARRSAATNMYNSGRMKTLQIMLITGHTTEKNFFRYIKVSREENAKTISTDLFFRK